MTLVYLTAKRYPSHKVDPFYVRSMAQAFAALLGNEFTFLIRGAVPDELRHINARGVAVPNRFRSLVYFILLPFLIVRRGWHRSGTYFLSYDPYLLAILIFWRRALRFRYRIASDWHQLFGDWRDRYVACGSDSLMTTSRRLKDTLVSKFGIDESRITVAYGGVDPEPYARAAAVPRPELRERLGLPAGRFLVGYVGGFTSVGLTKGLDTMIDALPFLPEDVGMVFVGGSPQQIAVYSERARTLGVERRCVFVVKQRFEKVVEYETVMDALVIPYPDKPHFREYGFPLKVWEYLAAGRPIVYSNLELIAEVLAGKGVPFTPESAQSLADAVRSVYDRRDELAALAARHREYVRGCTWDARARTLLAAMRH